MLTRRRWLASGLAAALALVARRASAIGPGSKFTFGQLQLGRGDLGPRPGALHRLAWEIEKRTSIDAQARKSTNERRQCTVLRWRVGTHR